MDAGDARTLAPGELLEHTGPFARSRAGGKSRWLFVVIGAAKKHSELHGYDGNREAVLLWDCNRMKPLPCYVNEPFMGHLMRVA